MSQQPDPARVAATSSPFVDDEWKLSYESIHPRDRARLLLPKQARKLVDALARAKNPNLSLRAEAELALLRELLNVLEAE